MKFNLDDINPAVWFDCPSDDDKGRVCVRLLPPEERSNMEKLCEIKRISWKRGQRITEVTVDQKKFNELMYIYCIVDWENIFDAAGNPIPCNNDMKVFLMGKSFAFSDFIGTCLQTLIDENSQTVEATEKNLQSS